MSFASLMVLSINCVLIENIVLVKFLGIRSFLTVSQKRETALGMGLALIFIMTVSSLVTWLLNEFVLSPLKLEYMQTVAFVLVIVAFVQLVEMMLKKMAPLLYRSLGVYLPLITTNCAVLGVALSNIRDGFNLLESLVCSFFSAIGFTLAIWMFACVRERIVYCDVPKPFQGIPIALITAALLSFAFMGFSGLSF